MNYFWLNSQTGNKTTAATEKHDLTLFFHIKDKKIADEEKKDSMLEKKKTNHKIPVTAITKYLLMFMP